jgi:hypothetical protein
MNVVVSCVCEKLKIPGHVLSGSSYRTNPSPEPPHFPRSVPHDGVSLDGDCMTYSIGFRAPAQRELLSAAATAAQALLEGDGWVRG